jgi:hypothetical protein
MGIAVQTLIPLPVVVPTCIFGAPIRSVSEYRFKLSARPSTNNTKDDIACHRWPTQLIGCTFQFPGYNWILGR